MAKFLFCQAPTFHHLEGIIKLASPFAPLIKKTFPGEQERRRGRGTKTYSLKTWRHLSVLWLVFVLALSFLPIVLRDVVLTSLLCYLPKLAVMKSFELHVHALFFQFSLLQTVPIHFPRASLPPALHMLSNLLFICSISPLVTQWPTAGVVHKINYIITDAYWEVVGTHVDKAEHL